MIRLFALTIAICAASTVSAETFYNSAPSFSGPHPAVVRVAAPERDGASYGSGALVAVNESSGLVLTNWHVVRDAAGQIVVYFPDGFRSGAYLLRTDRDWDLAALAIRRPNVRPIAIANEAPRPGEELTIAGYGSGSYRAVSGRLTQYVSPGGNQPFEMIELSAPARNGDSGGPILNRRGELAGTLFGSAFGRTTGSYCGRLQWFLNSVDGDFRRISAQAMLAQQSNHNPPPVAFINSPAPLDFGHKDSPCSLEEGLGMSGVDVDPSDHIASTFDKQTCSSWPQVNTAGKSAHTTTPELISVPAAAIPASPRGPLPHTDQIKSILALVGVLAVLYHALRFLGWAIG